MRFFTKEWYELMQEAGRAFGRKERAALEKQLNAVSDSFQQALRKEDLPEDLWRKFYFHDGVIRNVREGTDYVVEIDSPFTNCHGLTFRNAIVKQESLEIGAVWLYEELYRHALGYEAHILSHGKAGLRDTKIICSEIVFEE